MVNKTYLLSRTKELTTPLIRELGRSGSTSSPYISLSHFASSSDINYNIISPKHCYTRSSFALKLRRRAENDALSVTFVMISRLPDDILIGKLLSLIANKKKWTKNVKGESANQIVPSSLEQQRHQKRIRTIHKHRWILQDLDDSGF